MANPNRPPRPTVPEVALYRLYAANGLLLYVGISQDPRGRIADHRGRQPWRSCIEDWEWEWCRNRATAVTRERAAIRELAPLFNIDHNRERTPWQQMLWEVSFRTSPLPWSRVPDYALIARSMPEILEPLSRAARQSERSCCRRCAWPEYAADIAGLFSPGSRDGHTVTLTLWETLPDRYCDDHREDRLASHP